MSNPEYPTATDITQRIAAFRRGDTPVRPCSCYLDRFHGRAFIDCGLLCHWCVEYDRQGGFTGCAWDDRTSGVA